MKMTNETPKRNCRLPTIVPPEPVSDRSIIESVTEFINDVTLTNAPTTEHKEQIQWVRFETWADISNPSFGEDYDLENGVPPPIILILGYKTGVQIWAVPANGEATEVISWRHGVVRCLKILPTPISSYTIDNSTQTTDDIYGQKRPLMAICESSQMHTNGPQFCTMNIISLRDGDSIKTVKFKTTILDIMANHQSIVVTFNERIAVFDARTLEDRLTITTCYPCSGLSPNPVALGQRWLAFADRKLMPSKRSGGGCECDGVQSYTATVLNAAKTLSKGLRDFGEQVAAGLTGTSTYSLTSTINSSSTANEIQLNSGVVTILDIRDPIKETSATGTPITISGNDPIIAHFVAHTDVIAGMTFDTSGLLLLTCDIGGHNFHVFRINPHPSGSASASVHHLYILYRGDTSAKVQDMIFSLDSRWVAVTSARGTTHVFPISPYGGAATFRTHGSAEVVNRLSRFHRSAGLSADGRSSSPVFHTENGGVCVDPFHNPRLPPFPRPHNVTALKQLRQPMLTGTSGTSNTSTSSTISRQRQSDDATNIFRVCATFARPRDWMLQPLSTARDMSNLRNSRMAVDSLFIMAGHGLMIQYDLEPRYSSNVPASKQNDDSPIELNVEAKAQWNLLRKDNAYEIQPPLLCDNWLLKNRTEMSNNAMESDPSDNDEHWLSQVEIVTSSGPHRRLWMGPQFIFKTYNTPSGSTLQHIDSEATEIGVNSPANRPARSNPMQMPSVALGRGVVPVLIESGSASSIDQNHGFINQYQEHIGDKLIVMPAETQLREDLADAMRESPRDSGLQPNKTSTSSSSTSPRNSVSIAKVVNPLGTVTTITELPRDILSAALEFKEEYFSGAYLHDNCDESTFRPYVTVISGSIDGSVVTPEQPEPIRQKLIVPVIDGSQLHSQGNQKNSIETEQKTEIIAKFECMSISNQNDQTHESNEGNQSKPNKSIDKRKETKILAKSNSKSDIHADEVTIKVKKSTNRMTMQNDKQNKLQEKKKPSSMDNEQIDIKLSSKESSVEKECTPNSDSNKMRKKKQKKNDKSIIIDNVNNELNNTPVETIAELKFNSNFYSNDDANDSANEPMFEMISAIDNAQCVQVQESLLKSSESAKIVVKQKTQTKKSKKSSIESNDDEATSSSTHQTNEDAVEYSTVSESLDLDNLSFKSTLDAPQCEQFETFVDADKMPDESLHDGSFELIVDSPETFQIADANSSDETENSTQSKCTKSSEKTVDDDEELQPLICSTTSQSDTAIDLPKSDEMANDAEIPTETIEPQTTKSNQQQPQKQTNSTNNKKKFRKKRR